MNHAAEVTLNDNNRQKVSFTATHCNELFCKQNDVISCYNKM